MFNLQLQIYEKEIRMPRYLSLSLAKNRKNYEIVYYSGLPVLFQFVCYHVGATGTGEHEIAGRVVAAGAGANPRADQLAVYTPALFKKHVKMILNRIKDKPDEDKVIFLKSWNEWAEGNYMEPDLKWGKGYIRALREALEEDAK